MEAGSWWRRVAGGSKGGGLHDGGGEGEEGKGGGERRERARRACPAVSQICSLTRLPSSSTLRILKSILRRAARGVATGEAA